MQYEYILCSKFFIFCFDCFCSPFCFVFCAVCPTVRAAFFFLSLSLSVCSILCQEKLRILDQQNLMLQTGVSRPISGQVRTGAPTSSPFNLSFGSTPALPVSSHQHAPPAVSSRPALIQPFWPPPLPFSSSSSMMVSRAEQPSLPSDITSSASVQSRSLDRMGSSLSSFSTHPSATHVPAPVPSSDPSAYTARPPSPARRVPAHSVQHTPAPYSFGTASHSLDTMQINHDATPSAPTSHPAQSVSHLVSVGDSRVDSDVTRMYDTHTQHTQQMQSGTSLHTYSPKHAYTQQLHTLPQQASTPKEGRDAATAAAAAIRHNLLPQRLSSLASLSSTLLNDDEEEDV